MTLNILTGLWLCIYGTIELWQWKQ